MNNAFLTAVLKKYRFKVVNSNGGPVTANLEQLIDYLKRSNSWKETLNDIYLELEKDLKTSKGLLGKRTDKDVENKLTILRELFAYFEDKAAKTASAKETSELKQLILEAAKKQEIEEMIGGKTAAQLKKIANKL